MQIMQRCHGCNCEQCEAGATWPWAAGSQWIMNHNIFLLIFSRRLINSYFLLLLDIPDIPDDIRHLRLLQVADFSSNPIPKLPAGFSQLRSLTILGLNDMSLTSLPADFGWWVCLFCSCNCESLNWMDAEWLLIRTAPPSGRMIYVRVMWCEASVKRENFSLISTTMLDACFRYSTSWMCRWVCLSLSFVTFANVYVPHLKRRPQKAFRVETSGVRDREREG